MFLTIRAPSAGVQLRGMQRSELFIISEDSAVAENGALWALGFGFFGHLGLGTLSRPGRQPLVVPTRRAPRAASLRHRQLPFRSLLARPSAGRGLVLTRVALGAARGTRIRALCPHYRYVRSRPLYFNPLDPCITCGFRLLWRARRSRSTGMYMSQEPLLTCVWRSEQILSRERERTHSIY